MKRLFFILVLFLNAAAGAENPASPVEISAAKSLTWNRPNKTYAAVGDVIATQGDARIKSDTLTARYTDADGATDISKLEAAGNVVIASPPYTAYGDKGVYDVKTGNAVLIGKNLKIVTGDETLTARDKIEFSSGENRATAYGEATAVKGVNTLTSDVLSAFFTRDAQGKRSVEKITANGHVSIRTDKETAVGDNGVYDIPSQKAVLTGNVRIYQGPNWLEGTRAEVDMTTGISRLFGTGNADTEGRVKGVFFPKSKPEGF